MLVKAKKEPKPPFSQYGAPLEALSKEFKCLMTAGDMVQSDLPSSLNTVMHEEQSRIRRLHRLKLKQIPNESFSSCLWLFSLVQLGPVKMEYCFLGYKCSFYLVVHCNKSASS